MSGDAIQSVLKEDRQFPPMEAFAANANISSEEQYQEMWQRAKDNPEEFWGEIDWDYWESRQDTLCQNCSMHSGFEASVVRNLHKSPKDMMRMAAWQLFA